VLLYGIMYDKTKTKTKTKNDESPNFDIFFYTDSQSYTRRLTTLILRLPTAEAETIAFVELVVLLLLQSFLPESAHNRFPVPRFQAYAEGWHTLPRPFLSLNQPHLHYPHS